MQTQIKKIPEKITTKSVDKTISSGRFAQQSFEKYGCVSVVFYKYNNIIEVEIDGFVSSSFYYVKPKNQKEILKNNHFIDSFINKCVNSEEIKKHLFNH